MKVRTIYKHNFGTVYVVINETAELVEVHESEARAYESKDKHERNGIRGVVVAERCIKL